MQQTAQVCDLLCALPVATGGATLFAKNSDRPSDETQVIEWLAPRVDDDVTRATHVSLPAHGDATFGVLGSRPVWGWGLEHGVNERGLAAGNATIYTTSDPRAAADGLTGMDLVRLVLERSEDADRAVSLLADLLAKVGQGGSGHVSERRPYWSSFLLADPQRAYVVETSGNAGASPKSATCGPSRTARRFPPSPPRWPTRVSRSTRSCSRASMLHVECSISDRSPSR